jgi:nucleotide-binding universal stress UspA family protein
MHNSAATEYTRKAPSMKLESILLTTDFSACAERAYRPAVDLARLKGAEIELVHVLEVVPAAMGVDYVPVDLARSRKVLREKLDAEARKEVFSGVRVKPAVLDGYGAQAVVEYQRERGHDLVCVATHGRGMFLHLLLGSFAERLVRLVSCPVLTLRAQPQARHFEVKRILFPVDFSTPSCAAVEAVRFFSEIFHAKVLVFHVLAAEFVPASGFPASLGAQAAFPGYWEDAESQAREKLSDFVARELAGCDVDVKITVGQPVYDIVRCAADEAADLIVLSTHGRTGFQHMMLGSVAERLVQKAPCATLTVRPPKA